MANQEIKCKVESCKYNEGSNFCTLHDIVVGTTTMSSASKEDDTKCASFDLG